MKKKVLFLFWSCAWLFGCDDNRDSHTVVVFPSIMPNTPKAVNIVVDNTFRLVYDIDKKALCQIWKGKSNIQALHYIGYPKSQTQFKEQILYQWQPIDSIWIFKKEDIEIPKQVLYKGYSIYEGQVVISYEIRFDGQQIIDIRELPRIFQEEGNIGLERKFEAFGIPKGYTLEVFLQLGNVSKSRTYHTNGIFSTKEQTDYEDFYRISGLLSLSNQSQTYITTFFDGKENLPKAVANSKNRIYLKPEPNSIYPMLKQDSLWQRYEAITLSEHPSYTKINMIASHSETTVSGIDFFSDGDMIFSQLGNISSVILIESEKLNEQRNSESHQVLASGRFQPLNLAVVNDDIFVLQRNELTQLVDVDSDNVIDEYYTIASGWGNTVDLSETAFGLLYANKAFYTQLNMAVSPQGIPLSLQNKDRGKTIKVDWDGRLTYVTHGLQRPQGIIQANDNQIFGLETVSDSLPAMKLYHIRQNAFFGARVVSTTTTRALQENAPALWIPQVSKQIATLAITKFEDNSPYQNQLLISSDSQFKRIFLEKINNHYQGAVFPFGKADAGIQNLKWDNRKTLYAAGQGITKIKYNGKSVFDILSISLKENGFVITFTEELEMLSAQQKSYYKVYQWNYKHNRRMNKKEFIREKLPVDSVRLHKDGLKVDLNITGLAGKSLIYIAVEKDSLMSKNKNRLWNSEAWYSANYLPSVDLSEIDNFLTEAERAEGWELLFDGVSTSGWHSYGRKNLTSEWQAIEGKLVLSSEKGGHALTNRSFQDFEIEFNWKIARNGDTGIFYHVDENIPYLEIPNRSPEVQITDNFRNPKAFWRVYKTGALYGVYPPKGYFPRQIGKWNHMRIVVKDSLREHWLNDIKIVEYKMNSEDWHMRLKKSRLNDTTNYAETKKGLIGLEAGSAPIEFKNIKIKTYKRHPNSL